MTKKLQATPRTRKPARPFRAYMADDLRGCVVIRQRGAAYGARFNATDEAALRDALDGLPVWP